MNKKELRKQMLAARDNLSIADMLDYSEIISDKLIRALSAIILEFKPEALNILSYYAKDSEVDLKKLHRHIFSAYFLEKFSCELSLYFPRLDGKDMDFYKVKSPEDLEPAAFGLHEPKDYCEKLDSDFNIVLVPGLAFSKKLQRLGYGGGYYDRYFAKRPENILLGIAYNFQLLDELETDFFDIDMDLLLTN